MRQTLGQAPKCGHAMFMAPLDARRRRGERGQSDGYGLADSHSANAILLSHIAIVEMRRARSVMSRLHRHHAILVDC